MPSQFYIRRPVFRGGEGRENWSEANSASDVNSLFCLLASTPPYTSLKRKWICVFAGCCNTLNTSSLTLADKMGESERESEMFSTPFKVFSPAYCREQLASINGRCQENRACR